ncbi:MAG: DUF6526 family protein [Pedobacter sp.]|jgi:hypothetical protein|uniref:DUF6526 family protein n=1 Tax=Pedobacter sp. TaxID=1411316 RepID=UPI0035651666
MEQNLKNHSKYVTGYHVVLTFLILAGSIGAGINFYYSWNNANHYNSALLLILFLIVIILFWYVRQFPLKAQDRVIRAEENLRYFSLTGKLLPIELRKSQIIALRFAEDKEFVYLVEKVLKENLSAKDIKAQIKNWRADYYRM